MTKSRIFLWALVAFVAGVAVRSFVGVPYVLIWISGMAAAVALAIGAAQGRKKFALAGFFTAIVLIGVLRLDLVQRRHPDMSPLYGKLWVMQGVVGEDPVVTEKSQRLKVKITAIDNRIAAQIFFILATTRKYPAYALGDELKIAGVIERPENFSDFDYVSYLARDDIFAVMSFPQIEKTGQGKGNLLMLFLSRAKRGFEKNIDAVLPEPHAAFMKGLILGERASLPPELVEDFKAAGVSHIVALSGYNITLIGRSITDTLLLLTAPFAVSFWIATAAVILFVLLTGAAASVVRAGIMGVLVLVAQKEGRTYHMINALAFAAAAMIFHNPYILRFDAGFQLSFLATIGLVYLSPRVEQWVDRARSKLSFSAPKLSLERARTGNKTQIFPLKRIFVETLSAQITVLPLLIYLFGRVSLISPLANLAVLVAVPSSMAGGFYAGAAKFLSHSAAVPIGWIAWLLLEYQLRVIRFFAGLPFASVEVGAWAVVPLLALYAIIFLRIWKK